MLKGNREGDSNRTKGVSWHNYVGFFALIHWCLFVGVLLLLLLLLLLLGGGVVGGGVKTISIYGVDQVIV